MNANTNTAKNQKTSPHLEAALGIESLEVGHGEETSNAAQAQAQAAEEKPVPPAAAESSKPDGKQKQNDWGLTDEVIELVYELRESIKQVNPKRHTPKSLRRALAVASDIMHDIERLTA
jgi:hypothetical protein